ncbi:MAG: hypothetical protein L0215_16880 [Gemmataceae bacterium]|nr:hypothetical protein [Gemmataceae bacterium]
MGIDEHFFASPLEATSLGITQADISPNKEQAEKSNVTVPEKTVKPIGLSQIIERIEPVHQLAHAVIKSLAPLFGRLAPDLGENAICPTVLQFDEAVFTLFSVSQDDIGREVTEDLSALSSLF